jgi:8-oxo-dGTP pyrophosphatase MutT (NUDIX family)
MAVRVCRFDLSEPRFSEVVAADNPRRGIRYRAVVQYTETLAIELAKAVDVISSAVVDSEAQAALQEQILDFCRDHPDALYRTCLDGHITGSALVVDPSRAATLLIHHVKLDRWLQPGGHVDGSGDLATAARREAEEEIGIMGLEVCEPAIDLDIHAIPERGDEPAHLHLDVRFLVLAPAGSAPTINHESFDAQWVTVDDPEALISGAELRRLVDKGLAVAGSAEQLARFSRRRTA